MNSFSFISVLLGIVVGAVHSRLVPAAKNYPLLGSNGLVGVKDCGNNGDVLKVTSMYVLKCDAAPCVFSIKEVYKVFVEFKMLGNFTALSNTVTASALGFRVPILELITCNILIVGNCPFVEGETYLAGMDVDPSGLIPATFKPFLKMLGSFSGDIEITSQTPENTQKMCVTLPVFINGK